MREYGQPRDPGWQPVGESAETESPDELRVEIAQTRDAMSGTIDAIQEKLNPDRLKEQVTEAVQEQVETVKENIREATVGRAEQMVSNVGDSAQRAGSGFVETIKQNPIPAALAALGIGWLWAKRSGGSSGSYQYSGDAGGRMYYAGGQPPYGRGQTYGASSYGYGERQGYGRGQAYDGGREEDQSLGDRVGDATGQARDRVGDMTGQAKEKIGDLTGQAKETVGQFAGQTQEKVGQFAGQAQGQVGEWGGQMQYGARQAKYRFDQTLHENPLAVSAAAVTLGLAVGLSLPDTPLEDKLMGEARDTVMEKAQATAQETMDKVGQVAQQVQQTATETAKDAAQKQGLTGSPPQGGQSRSGTQSMPRQQNPQPAPPPTTGQ